MPANKDKDDDSEWIGPPAPKPEKETWIGPPAPKPEKETWIEVEEAD